MEEHLVMTLHSIVCLVNMRGYYWLQESLGTRDSQEMLRDFSGNFYMSFAMTLSYLHSRFLHVFVVPLDIDVDLCVGTFELVYF